MNGWALSGVTIIQDGVPLTVTDSRGGSVYGFGAGSAETSTAEFCAGGTPATRQAPVRINQRLRRLERRHQGVGGYFSTAVFNSYVHRPLRSEATDQRGTAILQSGSFLDPGSSTGICL